MTMREDDRKALEALELRLKTMLPEEYQDSYEDLQPVSMGSAGLKYGRDGQVAWNEMWDGFCDLAMAGGPPHKGTLLEPATPADMDAKPASYGQVVEEICRGVTMVTALPVEQSPLPGWIRVETLGDAMAGWLLRAIVMENVAARQDGAMLDLPAAPHFRVEKEIKNVVTVMAKTCHYWMDHMPRVQQRAIATLLAAMAEESPLVEPDLTSDDDRTRGDASSTSASIAATIQRDTGLRPSSHRYVGWLGLECPSVRAAIWMMRAMVVSNVLSRREQTVLFVPINPVRDPNGDTVAQSVIRIHRLATARGLLI